MSDRDILVDQINDLKKEISRLSEDIRQVESRIDSAPPQSKGVIEGWENDLRYKRVSLRDYQERKREYEARLARL